MIVMLNTLEGPTAWQCARSLAARLESGHLLDLWTVQPGEVERCISDLKEQGCKHLVVPGTFHRGRGLAALRRTLGQHDQEVYAFLLDLWGGEGPPGLHPWRAAVEREARRGDMGFALPVTGLKPEAAASLLWDDLHEPVVLADPDPRWPRLFAAERQGIVEVLGTVSSVAMELKVEHVGSTAVPGLLAKPIIDVLIIIHSLDAAADCIEPLARLGYAFIDYPQNSDRRFFRKGKPRTHHIQIVEQHSPAARAYIKFRDVLRRDVFLRKEYAALKGASQRELKDQRALYGERKTALVKRALAATDSPGPDR